MSTEAPDIYHYNDFRRFLEDYRVIRKKRDPSFTHQYICEQLGLPHTRGFFNNIVKGRRILTEANVNRFITLLRIGGDEGLYFRLLVKYNQSDNPSEKELYLERLIALNKLPTQQLDQKAFVYYRHWYNSVIRALLSIIDFDGNYAALAARVSPPISIKSAKDSIALQVKLGLLAKDERGFIKPTHEAIATGPLMRNKIIQHYQIQCLDLAKITINTLNINTYSMFTNIISVSDEGYEQLKNKIQQFKSEIRSLIQKDDKPPTKVYHMNINLFPGSK